MKVKDIFLTFQGEGPQMGRSAVFVRFAGCNLWSGREEDRVSGKGACARWCDTDFVGGTDMTAEQIHARARELYPWPAGRYVVLTGGEPALQPLGEIIDKFRIGWDIGVETNGTIDIGRHLDWIHHLTVSPKRGSPLRQLHGECLKVVVGPDDWTDRELDELHAFTNFSYYVLQPQDGPRLKESLARCIELARREPKNTYRPWRMGIQAHKHWGIQ